MRLSRIGLQGRLIPRLVCHSFVASIYSILSPPHSVLSFCSLPHLSPHLSFTMKLSFLATAGSLLAFVTAIPAPSSYVVHEKREIQNGRWARSGIKLNRDILIPMSFGLKQRNIHKGYDFLMDVSHPESSNYGKHWSMDKVFKGLFSPTIS